MEAQSVDRIPFGKDWQYEPKWDGFRCIVFRDDRSVILQSKSCKPLTRYFPDVVAVMSALSARRFVLDGEIVVPREGMFSFDDLLQRIHPAATRVRKLADETPALFIAFDLLADEKGSLTGKPLSERRQRLERFAKRNFARNRAGLYDDAGLLHHVGFTSSISRESKPALTKRLEKLMSPPGFTGSSPGGPSRWSSERSAQWQPLKPKLVVEVCFDHFSGGRFRHGTRLVRWRPDKSPSQCRMDQVTQVSASLMKLLNQRR
jgi:ATP-dependent DNA ligase